ncbi:conserved Plasmodium protein, unknown function [Plasmodium gallinaceum]|uniref:Basal complex transmembrane protein 1 n=1 Tax=Plasmodium gallinaceum TaxID=5849 RepID=A0A1J1GQY9_PLAGA|nr:conserved Plasmodium protein, unknown function [Plasmodium gallinaceum]CRG93695.1 conserved Plasmodium protein, unknown function [Plasmodium gallinaceum]
MKNINKSIHLENDDFSLNINNSNDFNQILDEIKLKQLQSEKEKTRKNAKSKIKTKNEDKNKSHKKELKKNTMEYKEFLRKTRNDHDKYLRKYKSEEKIKKKIFDDTPIFPHIKSLIWDHENENRISECSYNVENTEDEKLKKNNSINKNGNYTIYDIYANTLKKLSIQDENKVLKTNKKGNLYINDKKILDNRKNNSSEGINKKKSINLIKTNISNTSFDSSPYSIIERNESNNSKKKESVYDQKQEETKQKKSDRPNYNHSNNKNYIDMENFNNNYTTNNKLYNDNSLVDKHNIIKDNNYSKDNFHEERIKGKKKRRMEKEQELKEDEYEYENENENEDEDNGKNKEKDQDDSEDYYIEEENSYENSIKMEKNNKNNMNESSSLKSECFRSIGKEDSKKKQKMYKENSCKYNEIKKENDYLKTPFILSIECLDENEKHIVKKNEIKNKNIEIMNLNNNNDTLNKYDGDTYYKSNSFLTPVKNSPDNNIHYSLNDRTHKKKMQNGKQGINYSKSEVTTTDSEYSLNENLNISYENFKAKNKNKMFSMVDNGKNKKDLLKIINSKNILNIRKILRIMRELYIGFIGLQLIYFITYILFGNNSVYLIQIISISCTFFSLMDANYHGYLLNGFIDICIAIFLNVAILQNISGFKSLQNDNVLKNIAISNVVLLYMFSIFSFLNSYFIFKLHSLEKKSIKNIIRNIELRKEKDVKIAI